MAKWKGSDLEAQNSFKATWKVAASAEESGCDADVEDAGEPDPPLDILKSNMSEWDASILGNGPWSWWGGTDKRGSFRSKRH